MGNIWLNRLSSALDKIIVGIGFVGGILIVLTAFSITYDVILRYIFHSPTIWVTDVSVYLIIASTFFSLAYALKEKAHVRVDFVTNYLSGISLSILEIFGVLLSVLYCAVLTWEGGKLALSSFLSREFPASIVKIPMFIPKSFIPIGSGLILLEFIRILKRLFKDLIDSKISQVNASGINSSNRNAAISKVWVPGLLIFLLMLSFFSLKTLTPLGLSILFLVLLLIGSPVACALGLFGLFCFYFLFGGSPMMVRIPIMAYSTLDSPIMVALPLYILTSCILRKAAIGSRIYKFANVLVRHVPGGLGVASVIFCGLFAAMTGSSAAVASAVSLIAYPEMISRGYKKEFVIGLMAAGGTLGILFPPSLALMLYASMTNESLGSLFMAGVIPGLILTAMFCIYVVIVGVRDKSLRRESRATFKEILSATKEAAGGLLTIVIIVGGIYSGVFTPTESGAIAVVYVLIVCLFFYKTLSKEVLKTAILEAARISAFIMFIIIGANITGQAILMSQVSQNLLAFVMSMQASPWIIILSINIFLILLGAPLEAVTILVITLPILYPLIEGLGFSGLWFAVIMVINMELALISPPEGVNLFILQNVSGATAGEVSRGVIPFLIIMGLFLLLISCVPSLATWLPALMK